MFTGIIEGLGTITAIEKEATNVHFTVACDFTAELKIDQSLAHNGACLTVVSIADNEYTVTAIDETMQKTQLGNLAVGDEVNLERCVRVSDRLDGHVVQGHVDEVGRITKIEDLQGSWQVEIAHSQKHITVEKGSICVNGVSLTVVNSNPGAFSVALIPYTWEHTNFKNLKVGDEVNLEFDILGKYVQKLLNAHKS